MKHAVFKVEGRELIEYNNKPFVNLAIRIHDAVQNAKKYESHDIMRYIKSASNSKINLSTFSTFEMLF